jgi:hypothetical protein
MNKVSLDDLSAALFRELVCTTFQVFAEPDVPLRLELVAVTDSTAGAVTNGSGEGMAFESFSVLFDGPDDRPLAQGIHRFEHERAGCFELFIVPVSAERNARQYEAVFNRRVVG